MAAWIKKEWRWPYAVAGVAAGCVMFLSYNQLTSEQKIQSIQAPVSEKCQTNGLVYNELMQLCQQIEEEETGEVKTPAPNAPPTITVYPSQLPPEGIPEVVVPGVREPSIRPRETVSGPAVTITGAPGAPSTVIQPPVTVIEQAPPVTVTQAAPPPVTVTQPAPPAQTVTETVTVTEDPPPPVTETQTSTETVTTGPPPIIGIGETSGIRWFAWLGF